jgi:hypothetical protein
MYSGDILRLGCLLPPGIQTGRFVEWMRICPAQRQKFAVAISSSKYTKTGNFYSENSEEKDDDPSTRKLSYLSGSEQCWRSNLEP